MWCLDGAYGDFINPYAFQAKKGNNNPDILSWSQIIRINDKDTFLQINIAANSYNRDTLLLSKIDNDVYRRIPEGIEPKEAKQQIRIWSKIH